MCYQPRLGGCLPARALCEAFQRRLDYELPDGPHHRPSFSQANSMPSRSREGLDMLGGSNYAHDVQRARTPNTGNV
jgi:hypothetical protein